MKYTTIAPLLAKVTRDIIIMDSGLKASIKAWISEAIELGQTTSQQVFMSYEDDICDGLTELPTGHGTTLVVFLDGLPIRFRSKKMYETNKVKNNYNPIYTPYQQVRLPDVELRIAEFIGTTWIARAMKAVEEKVIMTGYSEGDTYDENGNYIQTTKLKGKLKVYYLGVPLDDEGFPMILDHAWLKEAVIQFVTWKLRSIEKIKGNPNESYQLFEKFLARAQNDIELPTYTQLMDEE